MFTCSNHCRSVLLGLSVVLAACLLGVATGQDQAKSPAQEAMQKMADTVGSFDFAAKINLSAVGQPGVEVNVTGTAKSEMVLSETGMLSVSEADNKQSINYLGYRTDANEYFNISLDPHQTALVYIAGNFVKPNVMKMTDPMNQMSVHTVFGKDGASDTTIRMTHSEAVFMEIKDKRVSKASGDVLKQLMSTPVKPTRINRKADSDNPGENYAPGHVILQKFAGNFTTEDGYKADSRMVAEGRFVLTHVTAPGEFLAFTAYDSAGKFFQQMLVGPSIPVPMYLQGPMQKDGSILMSDPFNPQGMKVVITFDANGSYSTSTSMGDQVVAQRTWVPEK